MVKRCKGRVRQSHTCQVPVAVRAPKLHKKPRCHRATCGSAAGALKELLILGNIDAASPIIHHSTHLFMHTSFQTRMPSGQSPGHRAPWVWHIRHTDSLHFCIFLVCILHNVYICIYKHTSGWGLPYFMPQQQSPSAVGAAGSQHNTQLKRIFLPSSPLCQYCLC